MAYHFDHLPHLKSLNLQSRQEIKIFYSKRRVTTWTIVLSWYLNYLTGYRPAYSFLLRNMKIIPTLTFSIEVCTFLQLSWKSLPLEEMSKKFGNILLDDLP